MASGNFYLNRTSGTQYLQGRIDWSSSSNGSSANSSNVSANMVMYRTNTGYTTYGTGTFAITINGNTKSENKSYSFTSTASTILSHSVTVPHNSDGTKTITISATYTGDSPIGGNGSASCTLDNIARISQINGANDFTLEGTTALSYTQYSSSFTQNLYIDLVTDGNTWITRTGYSSGSTVTISDSEILSAYRQLPSYKPGQTVSVKYYLATYSGSSNLGGVSMWKTMTIGGTSKTNINGTWKNTIPYVNANGIWKPCIGYMNVNDTYKRGKV